MDNIKKFISEMGLPNFIHNDFKNFEPGKTNIFYSGPYWDENEVEMAIKAFMTGKWLSSGEYVISQHIIVVSGDGSLINEF